MALHKRKPGGPWHVGFTVRGKFIRRSTGTTDRAKAEEFETALRARYWRQDKLGENVHTWREATQRYKRESTWRPTTRRRNEEALEFFERLSPVAVGAITADVSRAARDFVERSQRPPSANRIMAVYRGVLRKCVEWGWIPYCPPVPMAHVPEADPVFLTPEQCERLVLELPEHTRPAAVFSVLVGLRMSNTKDLKWSQIDFSRGTVTIPASHYKSKKNQCFPLSPAAVSLLKAIPQSSEYVFTFRGKHIRYTFNTKAFRKARKRAGLTCRWHDLRHTFASWLAVQGASDRVLQSMGGWASPRMPSKYAHLRTDDLRPWASAVGTNAITSLQIFLDKKPREKPVKQVVPEIGVEPTTFALRMLKAKKKS